MKNKVLAILLAVLIPLSAFADSKTVMKTKLVGLGMSSELSNYIANTLTNCDVSYDNADYIKWRNAAGTADISALRVDATDDTEVASDSGDVIKFKLSADPQRLMTFTGTSDTDINVSWGDGGVTAGQDFSVIASTADADDDSRINVCGGGGITAARGACFIASGNEDSVAGDANIVAGSASGSSIFAKISAASGTFQINNSADVGMWDVDEATGKWRNLAGGSDVSLALTGTTLAIQEATAGSACSGTVTFNGTTAVTKATTCATTGSRIFLTPTSDPTGATAAYCWVTNIVNGTSFDVDCDQANDGTANWIIFHEAA